MTRGLGDSRFLPSAPLCPHCGYKFEGYSGVDHNNTPSDGATAICIACTRVSVFTLGVTALRLPTPEEQFKIDQEPVIARMRRAILVTRELHKTIWPKGPNQ